MGIYLVALCFDPQWRKLKTNKRTKKHTVSKTHLWGSTCCPGSSGYSQSFFREMSLLCIFLQSVLIASNSHVDDFCQIDTGFVISRQEKSTPGMLKLGWGTGIEQNQDWESKIHTQPYPSAFPPYPFLPPPHPPFGGPLNNNPVSPLERLQQQ